MIQSWRGEFAEAVFRGEKPRRFPADLLRVTRRKLFQLDAATMIEEMRAPPGNRLEQLQGNRSGQWSVRVNDQYRICFRWASRGPEDVEFTDYH